MCQKSNQKQQIAVEVWALIKSCTPKSAELVSTSRPADSRLPPIGQTENPSIFIGLQNVLCKSSFELLRDT